MGLPIGNVFFRQYRTFRTILGMPEEYCNKTLAVIPLTIGAYDL